MLKVVAVKFAWMDYFLSYWFEPFVHFLAWLDYFCVYLLERLLFFLRLQLVLLMTFHVSFDWVLLLVVHLTFVSLKYYFVLMRDFELQLN